MLLLIVMRLRKFLSFFFFFLPLYFNICNRSALKTCIAKDATDLSFPVFLRLISSILESHPFETTAAECFQLVECGLNRTTTNTQKKKKERKCILSSPTKENAEKFI